MKHFIVLLITLFAFSAQAADFIVDGVAYDILSLEDKTCVVTAHPNKYHGNINIPETVTFQSISFNVEGIKQKAFSWCLELWNVVLPNSIGFIEDEAFRTSGLLSINVPSSLSEIPWGCFDSTNLTSIDIPSSITKIGGWAFWGCNSLKYINLTDGLTSIGNLAFYKCKNIENISLPNSLNKLEYSCFAHCTALKNISIPDNVESVEHNAFENCANLSRVVLGSSVNEIGENCFLDCHNLTAVYVKNPTPPELVANSFTPLIGSTAILYVPQNSLMDFKESIWGSIFQNICGISDFPSDETMVKVNFNYSPAKGVVNYENRQVSSLNIPIGSDLTFHVYPLFGYEINSVSIEDEKLNPSDKNTYSISNITLDTEVEILFSNARALISIANPEIGIFTTTATIGEPYDFSFTPSTQWEVDAIYCNGEIINSIDIPHSIHVDNVSRDLNINVTLKKSQEGAVNSVNFDNVHIYAIYDTIYIENPPLHSLVKVYKTDGTEVYSSHSFGETLSLRPNSKGVFIITCGSESYKVLVQ